MLACIALASWTVHAITVTDMQIGSVAGEGWIAEDIRVQVDLTAAPRAKASIRRVRFNALPRQPLTNLQIDCEVLRLDVAISCSQARIAGHFGDLGPQTLSGSLLFDRKSNALTFEVDNVRVAGSRLRLQGDWQRTWSLAVTLAELPLADVQKMLRQGQFADLPLTLEGRITGTSSVRGQGARVSAVEWQLSAPRLTANNAEGTIAAENLALQSRGSLTRTRSNGWTLDAQLASSQGQAFFEPVFLDTGVHPLTVTARGNYEDGTLDLQSVVLEQPSALMATGKGVIRFGDALTIGRADIEIERASLPGAYTVYLQPFFTDSAFGALETQGELSGALAVEDNAPVQLQLNVRQGGLANEQARFALTGVNGSVRWNSKSSSGPSAISWESGRLLGMSVGKSVLTFTTQGRDFSLTQPAAIPFLDGAVELAQVRVERAGQPDMGLHVDAALAPISVTQLSTAFGWPAFGGRLSGRVSDLQLRDGVVTLGTTLQADVFDGQVRIAELKLEQIFGKWPRLSADVAIENVDLEQVTSAFSFGRITGRLSGTVDDLRLFNWQPVAFDARLFTPAGDRSRHRISQRAVDSIGRLGGGGGGVTAALSTGFLRFFDDFNYERLGISCRLANDVCIMGGIEAVNGGYYLVKGSGLPRIDVIGNARRVDWPRMVAQLQAATRAPEVQVQ